MSCSRTQHSDAGEAWTCGPSVSSQALYHCATALSKFILVSLRGSHIQNVHLGRYIFGYTVGNLVLRWCPSGAVNHDCWHFNIYEQDKFCAQLSWVRKKFCNLGPHNTSVAPDSPSMTSTKICNLVRLSTPKDMSVENHNANHVSQK